MEGLQHFWALIPGADDAAKLRFMIAGAAGMGAVWGLVRWLRKEDLGTTAKTILKTQTSAEGRAAAERMELRELVLMLSARVEARLAALPDGAAMLTGSANGIMEDLTAAVERLSADGHAEALDQLAAGQCGPALSIFAQMRAASLLRASDAGKEVAGLARQQGALALLTDPESAMRHYASACTLDPDEAGDWNRLAALKLAGGDAEGAKRCYARSMELAGKAADPASEAMAASHLGLMASQDGGAAEACLMWRKALDLFRQIGMQPQIEQVEGWMRAAGCAE